MTFFFTMRHLLRDGSGLGLDAGGLLWFTDLTVQDPYYALPVVCGASFFGMVHLGDAGQAPGVPLDEKQQTMRRYMKFVALGMIPLTSWMESGVFVYWISTNAFGVVNTIALRQPAIRSLVGMPPLPAAAAHSGLLGVPGQQIAPPPPQPAFIPAVTYTKPPPRAAIGAPPPQPQPSARPSPGRRRWSGRARGRPRVGASASAVDRARCARVISIIYELV